MVIWKCRDVFGGINRLGGENRRGGYVGGTFLGGICHGGRKFMKGEQDFLALFKKKQWKNKYEKVFFNWKYGEALKLKTNRNYYAYDGLTSS